MSIYYVGKFAHSKKGDTMARVEKYKYYEVHMKIRHNHRGYRNSTNPDIKKDRTYLNYSLLPKRKTVEYEYFKQRFSSVPHSTRKDLVAAAGWVITLPADAKKAFDTEPNEEHKKFFDAVYDFCKDRYKDENIVDAQVHYDEISLSSSLVTRGRPHLHLVFIPVDKAGRICANNVLTKHELHEFHRDLQKYLKTKGIPGTVYGSDGTTGREYKTVKELKEERTIEAMVNEKLKERTNELNSREQLLNKREEQLNVREHELNTREQQLEHLIQQSQVQTQSTDTDIEFDM